MIDFAYLYKGLCALARAHRAGPMAGHLGAALTAGYFFGESRPDLHPKVSTGIEDRLDRIVRGEESLWYDPKKRGIPIPDLFQPFAGEKPRSDQIPTLARALARTIGATRQSGHNVIFASLAIRGLTDHPEYAVPSIVSGIRKLIGSFDGATSGRGYFGKERGWITGDRLQLDAGSDVPGYDSVEAMAGVVIDELIQRGPERRRGFGGLVHLVNHAAGIAELSAYGFGELAKAALPAHRQHLRLLRALPELSAELGRLRPAKHDPRTAAFWADRTTPQFSATLTHRIKTLYGFFTLLGLVEDRDKRKKAQAGYLYLLA